MVRAGTQVEVSSTGEADIYLLIDNDPSTMLYYSHSRNRLDQYTETLFPGPTAKTLARIIN